VQPSSKWGGAELMRASRSDIHHWCFASIGAERDL
jgi:hypothetical protein